MCWSSLGGWIWCFKWWHLYLVGWHGNVQKWCGNWVHFRQILRRLQCGLGCRGEIQESEGTDNQILNPASKQALSIPQIILKSQIVSAGHQNENDDQWNKSCSSSGSSNNIIITTSSPSPCGFIPARKNQAPALLTWSLAQGVPARAPYLLKPMAQNEPKNGP